MAEKNLPALSVKSFKYLSVPLTVKRVAELHKTVVEDTILKLKTETELKETQDKLKGQIKGFEKNVLDSVRLLHAGIEMLPIETRTDLHEGTNTAKVIRLDTNEIETERAMTKEEKQMVQDSKQRTLKKEQKEK